MAYVCCCENRNNQISLRKKTRARMTIMNTTDTNYEANSSCCSTSYQQSMTHLRSLSHARKFLWKDRLQTRCCRLTLIVFSARRGCARLAAHIIKSERQVSRKLTVLSVRNLLIINLIVILVMIPPVTIRIRRQDETT